MPRTSSARFLSVVVGSQYGHCEAPNPDHVVNLEIIREHAEPCFRRHS